MFTMFMLKYVHKEELRSNFLGMQLYGALFVKFLVSYVNSKITYCIFDV